MRMGGEEKEKRIAGLTKRNDDALFTTRESAAIGWGFNDLAQHNKGRFPQEGV
jgi:hypothetical protein